MTDKICLLEEATATTDDLTDDENLLNDDSSIDSDEDTGELFQPQMGQFT